MSELITFRDLVTATGKPRQKISEALAKSGAPSRKEPWPVVLKYLRESFENRNEQVDDGEPVTITAAELALKKKRGRKIDQDLEKGALEIQKLRGQMVPIDELESELDAIGELISSLEMRDAREHPSVYSDKTFAEVEAISLPRAATKIQTIQDALRDVGRSSAADLARQAKREKYGVDC